MPALLPDLIPSWGTASGRHVIVTSAGIERRVLARIPIDSVPVGNDRLLDAITTAQLLAAPTRDGNISDMTLPSGNAAMATSRQIKSLPGFVTVIQERNDRSGARMPHSR